MRYVLMALACLFVAACGSDGPKDEAGAGPKPVLNEWMDAALRKQAAFDFNCPAEQFAISEIGKYIYGVRGCSKRASYAMIACNRLTKACTYTMQSPVTKEEEAAAAPAPATAAPAAVKN